MSNQDLFMRLLDLTSKGYACSQILLMMGMELNGEENSAVVRTMAGLNEGMYGSGRLCGCLTGGSCLLGYFSGKGLDEEELEHPAFRKMVADFSAWFEETWGGQYGGINCDDILEDNRANQMSRCPEIVQSSFEKCMELLEENQCLG
ncbi:MAG: C_GCAxxG_C_C family protein [Peptococcaceae bacterium]|nr:C_GCAxxG_C_C family protein [Peptococcaceae bacterium]